ncbi:MAG: helix-turn-helix transcriptional regulator [Spirochaeta sp.]
MLSTRHTAPTFSQLVKSERKRLGLTQAELALRAGVGLRFVRDLEQGKPSLRLDTLNQVLFMFGYQAGPVPLTHPAEDMQEDEDA